MRPPEERRTISSITCPECHGSMQEIVDREFVRYRCHTGHALTLGALGAIQADAWERALYNAYRAQQERAMLVGGRGARPRGGNRRRAAAAAVASYEEGADLLRDLLAHGRSGDASEDRES
jgi:two-component system chemotaxis response regulator CheB